MEIIQPLPTKDKGFSLKSLMQHRIFAWIFKILFAGVLFVVLYFQLFNREDLSIHTLSTEFVNNVTLQNFPFVLFVVLLMPLNWFFETRKWLSLMQNFHHIPFGYAFKAVLAGLTFSLFTPNRIGEYGGRLLMVEKDKRVLAVYATIVGSFSQWIVLVVGGWWGMMGAFYYGVIPIENLIFSILLGLGFIFSVVLFVLYFKLDVIIRLCIRFRFTRKWVSKLKRKAYYKHTKKQLLAALTFSFFRYLTYSSQYLLLLYFFGFEAGCCEIILGIMIVYLLQTGIPLPPSTGLLARGNIALLIFGYLSSSAIAPVAILASTFSLWIINVVSPAIVGAVVLLQRGWNCSKSSLIHPAPL
ncbi:MAG: flippase-like domain-containing protein [Saprospiraceae bacterium]|nr:flippase-like domain-containing protein [Saprospiraceae bacterium]